MKTTQQKPTSITVTLTPLVAIGLLMTAITPIFASNKILAYCPYIYFDKTVGVDYTTNTKDNKQKDIVGDLYESLHSLRLYYSEKQEPKRPMSKMLFCLSTPKINNKFEKGVPLLREDFLPKEAIIQKGSRHKILYSDVFKQTHRGEVKEGKNEAQNTGICVGLVSGSSSSLWGPCKRTHFEGGKTDRAAVVTGRGGTPQELYRGRQSNREFTSLQKSERAQSDTQKHAVSNKRIYSGAKSSRTSTAVYRQNFKEIVFECTGYCACSFCCEGWSKIYPRRTANGHIIKAGDVFVAAPKGVPFGTIMQIPGYNGGRPVEVKDRGGAIKGNKLDLYFSTHKEALIWGRKQVKVRVYEYTK